MPSERIFAVIASTQRYSSWMNCAFNPSNRAISSESHCGK